MARRRLQVLADREEIDPGRAHVVHHLMDLALLLAEPDHQAGLGEHRGVLLLDPVEQAQRVVVARARPHRAIEPRHGLEVVVVDVGPRRRRSSRARRACAGNRASGSRSWSRARSPRIASMQRTNWNAPPSGRSSRSTEVITMCLRPSSASASARCSRLVRVDRARQPGLDVAEGAGAGADVAQDHHRGVTLLPALADVGAGRLLAHGVQALGPHQPAGLVIAAARSAP